MHFSARFKRILSLTILFTFFLTLTPTSVLAKEEKHILPLPPRFVGELNVSRHQVEEGDLMAPLYGNANQIFYANVGGKYGNFQDSSMVSVGAGYRGVFGDNLLGVYLFGDSNRMASQHRFRIANPGIEWMNNRWDFRLNGYIPISKRVQLLETFLGEELGMTNTVSFSGHTKYDILFSQFESVGRGIDMELGLTLPIRHRVRLFFGGYHFKFKEAGSMQGVEGGVDVPVNRIFTVGVKGRADTMQGGAVFLTLRVSLGGKNRDLDAHQEVQDRILDPIPRHLATIGKGSGVPTNSAIITRHGQKVPVLQNVWFFTANGGSPFVEASGLQNCTFENPCNAEGYNQNNVNIIHKLAPSTHFYFTPGVYPLVNNVMYAPGAVGAGTHQITLNPGQSNHGRTRDYLQPALDHDRPILAGSIHLTGENELSHINMQGSGTQETVGITANGASNLVLRQVGVSHYKGSDGIAPHEAGGHAAGISIINSLNVELTEVLVSNIVGGAGGPGFDTAGGKGGMAEGIELTNTKGAHLDHTMVANIKEGLIGQPYRVSPLNVHVAETLVVSPTIDTGVEPKNFNFAMVDDNNDSFINKQGIWSKIADTGGIELPKKPERLFMKEEMADD